jgi:hypothetical protein
VSPIQRISSPVNSGSGSTMSTGFPTASGQGGLLTLVHGAVGQEQLQVAGVAVFVAGRPDAP